MGLLDNLFKKDGKEKPRSDAFNLFGSRNAFQGTAQSLGGTQPGQVHPITLAEDGPLGVRVERRPNSQGTAIVNEVLPGTQAERAGLQRGDILCFAGSNGQEELMYDMFLELAKSGQRPIQLDIRRLPKNQSARAPASGSTQGNKSAEADHRRQAVIAAAEAREKAHKSKSKPIKQVTKTTLARQQEQQELASAEPQSEAARKAATAAKHSESQLAQELGYNPYETSRASAGQARNATTTVQHGQVTAQGAGDHMPSSDIPATRSPAEPAAAENNGTGTSYQDNGSTPPPEFDHACATLLSSTDSSAAVQSSCNIMKKLLLNATTKGQAGDTEEAAKFRKVRLGNPKIQAALVGVEGAMDIMLLAGFVLYEEGGESFLVFPANNGGPRWLVKALEQLDGIAQQAVQ